MKLTPPAASARVALTTSRPRVSAQEGFQAVLQLDSRATHLQMFSHSQLMHADVQEHSPALTSGREGRREEDEVSPHAQTHNTEVWMELGLSLLSGWRRGWTYIFQFCILEHLNWLKVVHCFQSVQIFVRIAPYKLPCRIAQWLERVCILIKVADSSGSRTVCVGWWWDVFFMNVLDSRGLWVVQNGRNVRCSMY